MCDAPPPPPPHSLAKAADLLFMARGDGAGSPTSDIPLPVGAERSTAATKAAAAEAAAAVEADAEAPKLVS